jgi:cobalt-zinc-cadmium efflux system protein
MGHGHDHGHSHHHHHHDHGHHHHHDHDHLTAALSRGHIQKLKWVFVLTVGYMLVEFAGGWFSHSLALMADAAHMFADSTAIGLSLFAAWFSLKPASRQKTFGYQRAEILAALFNAILLTLLALTILYEGYERFNNPLAVDAGLMLKVAIGGFLVNIAAAYILHAESHTNLNIKGAYLHVLGDLMGSVGAIAASLLMIYGGYYWADPLISILIALLVLFSAFQLLKEAINILLEGCPSHISVSEIREAILNFEGIQAVHHLHVWNINTQRIVLTAHLVVTPASFSGDTLTIIQEALKEKFGLSHVTLQLELS